LDAVEHRGQTFTVVRRGRVVATIAPARRGSGADLPGRVNGFDVVAFDIEIARRYAALPGHARRSGRPRGAHDLQIAATARATGRVLITPDAHAVDDLPAVDHRVVPGH
jgi:tRNA(fMet)-specific endonuclease VapC